MRITNKSLNSNMLRNLNQGLNRLDRFQQQLATGKRVLQPSDDPAAVTSIMQLKTSLIESEQYIQNVEDGSAWLDSTDTTLDAVTSVLQRARELTVYGANDTLSETDREALSREIDQLFDNVLQLSNASHGGKYLFAGQLTTTRPFSRASTDPDSEGYFKVDYHGGYVTAEGDDLAGLPIEIGVASRLVINIVGAKEEDGAITEHIFSPVFQVLTDIRSSLMAEDGERLSNTNLAELDRVFDGVLSYRSEVGAKVNRLELSKDRLLDLKLNFNRLLSHAQDIDVAETIMHLKSEENIYRTALSVGARIIQPSLVDFLR